VFVLTHLKEAELKHAPEADRVTLIRRLHFDLVGLPPTKEQVDAFVNEKSAGRLREGRRQLLASPHYGERMRFLAGPRPIRRHIGYHSDNPSRCRRTATTSSSRSMRTRRSTASTIEQLGGDLLPTPARKTRIASTYNRLLQTTKRGRAAEGIHREICRRSRAQRRDGVARSDVGCAECHDPQFDPDRRRATSTRWKLLRADVQEAAVGGARAGSSGLSDDDQAKVKQFDGQIAD